MVDKVIQLEARSLIQMMSEINDWLEDGKSIKNIRVEVSQGKFFSHKAFITLA